jgi:hypothetical protein
VELAIHSITSLQYFMKVRRIDMYQALPGGLGPAHGPNLALSCSSRVSTKVREGATVMSSQNQMTNVNTAKTSLNVKPSAKNIAILLVYWHFIEFIRGAGIASGARIVRGVGTPNRSSHEDTLVRRRLFGDGHMPSPAVSPIADGEETKPHGAWSARGVPLRYALPPWHRAVCRGSTHSGWHGNRSTRSTRQGR